MSDYVKEMRNGDDEGNRESDYENARKMNDESNDEGNHSDPEVCHVDDNQDSHDSHAHALVHVGVVLDSIYHDLDLDFDSYDDENQCFATMHHDDHGHGHGHGHVLIDDDLDQ